MNPGTFYFYHYTPGHPPCNVGFLKLNSRFSACSIELHIRNIPVSQGDTLKLGAFYPKDDRLLAVPLSDIVTKTNAVFAKYDIPETLFANHGTLPEVGGFFLTLPDGNMVAATMPNTTFHPQSLHFLEDAEPMARKDETRAVPTMASAEDASTVPAPEPTKNIAAAPATTPVEHTSEIAATTQVERVPETAATPTVERAPETATATRAERAPETAATVTMKNAPETAATPTVERAPETAATPTVERAPETATTVTMKNAPETATTPPQEETPGIPTMATPMENDAPTAVPAETMARKASATKQGIRKISRQELRILPRKYWNLSNNSFLMHGYYNYNHLLLVEKDGYYLVGVPGIYSARESHAASLFGFPKFTDEYNDNMQLTSEEQNNYGTFGYWCCEIRIPAARGTNRP